jgi:uncharacterized protein
MFRSLSFSFIVACSLLMLPAVAKAASFDCAKANTTVEKTICADPKLGELDKALAEIYTIEVARESESVRVKSSQREWLAKRNTCATNSCIEQSYDSRLADMHCDPKSTGSGSGYASAQCGHFSLKLADRELLPLEANWLKTMAKDSNNVAYLAEAFKTENKAWRENRRASCALYGATEGGLDIWKTAFALGCELKETQTRINRLKSELR